MIKNYPRIDYSNKFNKQLKKAPLEIKIAFRTRLELFLKDRYHPQLNNHLLTGKFSEYRSINVIGDWRAIFKELRVSHLMSSWSEVKRSDRISCKNEILSWSLPLQNDK